MRMKNLTWRNYFDLSLLSYFDVYEGNETVEDLILDILLDHQLIEDYKDDVMFQMNLESIRHIYPREYRDVRIVEVFDDNANSGVYLMRLAWRDCEIISIRGSEELDDKHGTTGWQDWKDNFDMYLPGPTLQQLVTLHYIHQLDPNVRRTVTGHSKGGNLSIYVAMCAGKALFDSIEQIVAFNAPGITDSLMQDYAIRIQDHDFQEKVTLIENEHDCISSFFHHVKTPIIVKSNTAGNTLRQLYENHQLHTMIIEGDGFIATDRKSTMPRLVHHFINDFFVKMSTTRLQAIVNGMDEYFNSGLSKQELYRVLIYQISKYTNLFDELSYDEVSNITFQDLIERRKSRYVMQKIKELTPDESITIVFRRWKEESPLANFDVKKITNLFIENYETTIASHTLPLKAVITENNRRIMETLKQFQINRDSSSSEEEVH